tara:strand:- start:216 stop:353 length:138 start_codon:yes stop_codon:yes gene_type:complete
MKENEDDLTLSMHYPFKYEEILIQPNEYWEGNRTDKMTLTHTKSK